MNTKEILISDYNYLLPQERIALHPLPQRDSCKLLTYTGGEIGHHTFSELPQLLPSPALMVCNNTKVINARIRFRKSTGAVIEVFCLEPDQPRDYALMFQSCGRCRWICLVGNLKRWKEESLTMPLNIDGEEIQFSARRISTHDERSWIIEFEWTGHHTFATILKYAGYIPIPPYLKRDTEAADADDYQTVYSRVEGSVAAPTAGLHFTPELMSRLHSQGICTAEVTLQVGAGTFQPVKAEHIGEHPMHTEVFSVSKQLIESLTAAVKEGTPIVAVGTTSVRTLESLPLLGKHILEGRERLDIDQWEAYDNPGSLDTVAALQAIIGYMQTHKMQSLTSATSIMIAPGFCWRIVDMAITNFHQPQSTLLLLVSSFLDGGGDTWRHIYNEALSGDYRFLSYGDACLFERGTSPVF